MCVDHAGVTSTELKKTRWLDAFLFFSKMKDRAHDSGWSLTSMFPGYSSAQASRKVKCAICLPFQLSKCAVQTQTRPDSTWKEIAQRLNGNTGGCLAITDQEARISEVLIGFVQVQMLED